MAIADLLWACPSCGEDRGISRGGREVVCRGCGTRFERVGGARIRARHTTGEEVVRTPAEWLDALPDPASLLEAAPGASAAPEEGSSGGDHDDGGGYGTVVRSARVKASFVVGHEVVRDEGRYLNRIEIYGEETDGTLELRRDAAVFRPDGEGDEVRWHLDELTAVQASSRQLQLKARGRELAAFAFVDDSSFLWERLVEAALQCLYQRAGRGEIVELQPRICVR